MYKIGNDFVLGFLDFRALIGKFPSWKKKVTSQAKLKIVQLEPWLEPARLGLITRIEYYVREVWTETICV